MFTTKVKILVVLLLLGLVVLACGSFGPLPSCSGDVGGTADTVKFDQYFTSVQLVSQESGQPGPEGENGEQYSVGDSLVIQVESKSEVAVRACIQPRGPGEITFDRTQTLPSREGTFPVGTFEPGNYVIRVIVDNTLVKNFPFTVK